MRADRGVPCSGIWFLATAILLAGPPTAIRAQTETALPSISGFIQAGFSANLVETALGSLPTMPAAGSESSFHLHQARIYLQGSLEGGLGYTVQTNLAGGFSLLTAYLSYRPVDGFEIRAGQLLKPFGRDRLRPVHRLMALNRTVSTLQVVKGLHYGHYDIGVMVTATPGPTLQAGVFNGNGAATGTVRDDDTGKNIVARCTIPLGSLELGADVSLLRLGPDMPAEGRNNLAWGIDAAGEVRGIRFEVEMICAGNWTRYSSVTGTAPKMWTAAATCLVPLPGTDHGRLRELVIRAERLDPSDTMERDEVLYITPNLNLPVSEASRLQVGLQYEAPQAEGARNALSFALLWQVDFF